MKLSENKMTTIIDDLEKVVGTQSCFLTGKWIKDARAWGKDPTEQLYYERNARNIITTWADKNMGLNDYAYRSWAGLVRAFYGKRWRMFFKAVEAAVKAHQPFDEARYDCYKDQVCTFEPRYGRMMAQRRYLDAVATRNVEDELALLACAGLAVDHDVHDASPPATRMASKRQAFRQLPHTMHASASIT